MREVHNLVDCKKCEMASKYKHLDRKIKFVLCDQCTDYINSLKVTSELIEEITLRGPDKGTVQYRKRTDGTYEVALSSGNLIFNGPYPTLEDAKKAFHTSIFNHA